MDSKTTKHEEKVDASHNGTSPGRATMSTEARKKIGLAMTPPLNLLEDLKKTSTRCTMVRRPMTRRRPSSLTKRIRSSAYITMQDNGLDCENQETLEYAAEMLQAQSEAFYTPKRAQQKGHTGFTPDSFRGGKGFRGKGKMTSEEKKARIEALKKRTTCRKCGQTGHWSTDFSCPKNRKGGGKGSSSSTTSTATGTGFKGGKKGGSNSSSKTSHGLLHCE